VSQGWEILGNGENTPENFRECQLQANLIVPDYDTYHTKKVIITYGHFHIVDQSESVLPRKARIARSRCLVDFELFAQIVNGRREQLHGIVDQSGLQLYTNIIRLAPIYNNIIRICFAFRLI